MRVFKYLATLSLALVMTSIAGCDDSAHRAWVIGGVPMGSADGTWVLGGAPPPTDEGSYPGPSCVSNCGGRQCGPDPVCGESCGTCDSDEVCSHEGNCVSKPDSTTGIEWVRIVGGSFDMGSDDGGSFEKPVHRVTVPTFEISKTAVTFKQYQACVSAGDCTAAHVDDGTCFVNDGSYWGRGTLPSSFQGDSQPVVCVDWDQAQAFARWAGGRFPSEAGWGYAARCGGRDWKYPWGDEEATCERAVIEDGSGNGCGRDSTWPVCSKPTGNTTQGLCDMAGNVWEWVQDWYHSSYDGAPTDGSAWESPTGSNRVIRGGSWYGDAWGVRAAVRGAVDPGRRGDDLGFRLARSVRPALRISRVTTGDFGPGRMPPDHVLLL